GRPAAVVALVGEALLLAVGAERPVQHPLRRCHLVVVQEDLDVHPAALGLDELAGDVLAVEREQCDPDVRAGFGVLDRRHDVLVQHPLLGAVARRVEERALLGTPLRLGLRLPVVRARGRAGLRARARARVAREGRQRRQRQSPHQGSRQYEEALHRPPSFLILEISPVTNRETLTRARLSSLLFESCPWSWLSSRTRV